MTNGVMERLARQAVGKLIVRVPEKFKTETGPGPVKPLTPDDWEAFHKASSRDLSTYQDLLKIKLTYESSKMVSKINFGYFWLLVSQGPDTVPRKDDDGTLKISLVREEKAQFFQTSASSRPDAFSKTWWVRSRGATAYFTLEGFGQPPSEITSEVEFILNSVGRCS